MRRQVTGADALLCSWSHIHGPSGHPRKACTGSLLARTAGPVCFPIGRGLSDRAVGRTRNQYPSWFGGGSGGSVGRGRTVRYSAMSSRRRPRSPTGVAQRLNDWRDSWSPSPPPTTAKPTKLDMKARTHIGDWKERYVCHIIIPLEPSNEGPVTMRINIARHVQHGSIAKPSRPLLPIFEAVVNSIQSLRESHVDAPLIEIIVARDLSQTELSFSGGSQAPPVDFTIIDNGLGFTTKNFAAFGEANTDHRQDQGGKGVGRFSWLSAFEQADIDSLYREDDQWWKRTFDFRCTPDGIESHKLKKQKSAKRPRTAVSMKGMQPAFQKNCPKRLRTIGMKLIEHCLSYLLQSECPRIKLSDHENDLDINHLFEQELKPSCVSESFQVQDESFKVTHVRIHEGYETKHRIHYVADHREVRTAPIPLPHLANKLVDDHGTSFTWSSFIEGGYLDRGVAHHRFDFRFPITRGSNAELFESITLEDIEEAAMSLIEARLEPFIGPIREQNYDEIARFVNDKSPKYRVLLRHYRESLETVRPGLPDDKLELELHKTYARVELEVKQRAQKFLKRDISKVKDYDKYKKEYSEFLQEANEIGKANLADYIVHRKLILDLLERNLEQDNDGKYSREESIHELIFPMRTTSDDVSWEQQNLWVLDEKLSYHEFFASDKTLASLPVAAGGGKEPDLLGLFKHPVAFAHGEAPHASFVIVEFKRPGLSTYTDNQNPINQVYGYIETLRSGKGYGKGNRRVGVPTAANFFCYIVCDPCPKIEKFAYNAAFKELLGGGGYYGYNSQYSAYVEVVSYEKLLSDAQKRNKVLFERLGLSC